jgi:hypothetical protein
MKPFARFVSVVAGLVLLLTITPSWGQTPTCARPGCNPTTSDANGNTAGGTNALAHVDDVGSGGIANTAFGDGALRSNSSGSSNTATGNAALDGNTTGSSNTATGNGALASNISGSNNTATGKSALLFNTAGGSNTATGLSALQNNDTGDLNTAVGLLAVGFNSAGSHNTAVGAKVLLNSTGSRNIAIGFKAGVTLTTGNNNIYIGNVGAGDESQAIRIGTAQTQTFIAGINGTPIGDMTVMIDSVTGQLGTGASSARYKRDIETMASRSEGLLKLRPVTFVYKDDTAAAPHYGLIAEEVATVYPELVTRTASGDVQTVKYHELIPMLLNELQHEHQARQQESARVAALEAKLAALEALVAARLGQTVAQDGPGASMR